MCTPHGHDAVWSVFLRHTSASFPFQSHRIGSSSVYFVTTQQTNAGGGPAGDDWKKIKPASDLGHCTCRETSAVPTAGGAKGALNRYPYIKPIFSATSSSLCSHRKNSIPYLRIPCSRVGEHVGTPVRDKGPPTLF